MTRLNTPLKLITSDSGLDNLCEILKNVPRVAVDTESNSLYAYREQVCLIQFSTTEADYLVDPLVIGDISPLGEIFSSKEIEKIFHAAEYDLLTLNRDFGFSFCNLFDTMLAARIAGRKKIGLATLLDEEYGVKVEKKYQRANWGRRPLSPEMQLYARLDTHYLIQLRNLLHGELKDLGRRELAQDDFVRLCQINGTAPEPQEVDVWRISGVRVLNPQQVTILRYLAEYREAIAEKRDRPLFKIFGDRILVAIAETQPHSLKQLKDIPGMNHHQIQQHGKSLLEAVRLGESDQPSYRKHSSGWDDRVVLVMEILREWRKKTARKNGVESDVILPRLLVEKIASKQPKNFEELSGVLRESPWRLENYGEQIWDEIREVVLS